MTNNRHFHKAKVAKNNEFFTRLCDIEEELSHYRDHFQDKVIYCNTDDPKNSNFWRYFHQHFSELGLRKLISTYYDSNPYRTDYSGGNDDNISVGVRTKLNGNGDFRSSECLDILRESDIVVTNPAFSLIRQFIPVLMENEKDFIIIGSLTACSYKSIFPYICDNRLWLGCFPVGKDMYFDAPDDYKEWVVQNKRSGYRIIDGDVKKRLGSACWLTTLDHDERHIPLELNCEYDPESYQRFDYYEDVINVDRLSDIPKDYDGVMGVPITILGHHDPDQFEILDCLNRYATMDVFKKNEFIRDNQLFSTSINGKTKYNRILIKRKN